MKISNSGLSLHKASRKGKNGYVGYIASNGKCITRSSSNQELVNMWLDACVMLIDRYIVQGLSCYDAFVKATSLLKQDKNMYKQIKFEYLFPDSSDVNGQLMLNFKYEKEEPWMKKCRELEEYPEGYTYIMHNNENGLYKIGKASNIYARWASLCSPYISVIMYKKQNIEKILHTHYANKRKYEDNEWFCLDQNDLSELKNTFCFCKM